MIRSYFVHYITKKSEVEKVVWTDVQIESSRCVHVKLSGPTNHHSAQTQSISNDRPYNDISVVRRSPPDENKINSPFDGRQRLRGEILSASHTPTS